METWNVSNVTNMELMFGGVINLNVDIGSWNVAKVKNMENMFCRTGGVKQNLEMWQISSDCNIRDMFKDSSLEKNLPKLFKVINGETRKHWKISKISSHTRKLTIKIYTKSFIAA
ncbi:MULTISPECIES: BspA family leucine-rich repeat surface protein [Helicobacter]|uniref:BspA family leucine-rich repeat surface protein n=1 Tax=Helicobacter TaxID=209 RepID=UPI0022A76BB6|nr:BspA family leucine-rich repeat surface protein [Helicobacter sp. MIT 03-1616]